MVSFGKTAEFLQKYVKKGTKLCIRGRIQTGSYEKDGKKIYTTDVVAEDIEFAESKKSQEQPKEDNKDDKENDFITVDMAELPFA
jgi:single-strand DNA-binding protein